MRQQSPIVLRLDGAWRFLGGTPSPLAVEVAACGYAVIADVGVDAVRAHSLALTAKLIAGADAAGLTVRTPRADDRRGPAVVFDFEAADRACAALLARRVWLDHRPGYGLRVGPHLFTRPDEIDRFFDELAAVRRQL